MALLEIKNVSRRFGDFTAVDDVSFTVESGEFFTLLGPSGCGKTTLLRMIAGFDLPDSGAIVLDGVDLRDTPAEQRPIHTVFQSYALFPHMTVAQNIAFPLRMAGKGDDEVRTRVREAVAQVKLDKLEQRYPHELSGGQKQRVALARGLVNRPRLLLLDEPLGALDAKLREQMQIELIRLQRGVGVTFVFVTHSQAEALALSHRIAVMNHGVIEQMDEPDKLYGFPKNRFVADFIGNVNMHEATVAATGGTLTLELGTLGRIAAPSREGVKAGTGGVFVIRPEQVSIRAAAEASPDPNQFEGVVNDFLYIGDVTTYIVDLPDGKRFEALLPNSAPGRAKFFEVGDHVRLSWKAEAGAFLDA
ncbi:MAG: ABC transporter ATP-binding protein [Betaproteobacteria bacterium]|jgi:spermidine/putrescine transport system ATP-binding protein|nr:ABC transporter ATP-binding protein [Betaproteobacteria bacterium]MBK9675012.1 ABC transporter ATP-binding protein [Betaproteobacteria bacterium]